MTVSERVTMTSFLCFKVISPLSCTVSEITMLPCKPDITL